MRRHRNATTLRAHRDVWFPGRGIPKRPPVRTFREQGAAIQYCRRVYNETSAGQITETGAAFGSQNLRQVHSRLTAYAAVKTGNPALATRTWQKFYTGPVGYPRNQNWASTRVKGPTVLKPVDEAGLSANASAPYGLAAIRCLALIGDKLPG